MGRKLADCFPKGIVSIEVSIIKLYYNSGTWISALCEETRRGGSVIKVSGNVHNAVEGNSYVFNGEYFCDPKYGWQFKIHSYSAPKVLTETQVVNYLCSGFIKGLGPSKAAKVWDAFKQDTYKIIETDWKRLTEVKGINLKTAQKIHECYMETETFRILREWLPPEISDNKCVAIYDAYKSKAIEKLKENPYCVMFDIDRVGFLTADKIAKLLGVTADDPRRITAAVLQCLTDAEDKGHCYTFIDTLQANVDDFLKAPAPIEVLAAQIQELKNNHYIYVDTDGAVYRKGVYYAEVGVADCVRNFVSHPLPENVTNMDIRLAEIQMEKKTGFTISNEQRNAVEACFRNRISVITGGPGTGKSTIIDMIVSAWQMNNDKSKIALAAPTGKASQRMTEITGIEAFTIHRMLGYRIMGSKDDPEYDKHYGGNSFFYNSENKLPYDLIVVDECSMLDIRLANALLSAVGDKARIVLVGDVDQLPPIGPGNFFRDLISCYVVPTTRLKLSFRQHGSIAINAAKINNGEAAHAYIQDETFKTVKASPEKIQAEALKNYLELVKIYGVNETLMISPMRRRSATATDTLNRLAQEAVNGESAVVAKFGDRVLRMNDRVLQVKNDARKEVFNGEMGYIMDCNPEIGSVTVMFDDGKVVEYTRAEIRDNLILCYAVTTHKIQGSECKASVVCCSSEHWYMLQRNLLYTAVTRAKERVVLIGDMKAIAYCVKTIDPVLRNTKLKQRITAE